MIGFALDVAEGLPWMAASQRFRMVSPHASFLVVTCQRGVRFGQRLTAGWVSQPEGQLKVRSLSRSERRALHL